MSQATFSRARNAEQRARRREDILAAAVQLLSETRVADLSLNELARRVGLAKSNVLRYFESREAVLLQLYVREFDAWLDTLDERLASTAGRTAERTPETLAAAVADTAAERPVFAELCATAPGSREHNISAIAARNYKRAVIAEVTRLGALSVPWIGDEPDDLLLFAGTVTLGIGGIWSSCRVSPAMEEAYAFDPELARYRLDFRAALETLLVTMIRGLRAG